MTTIAYANSLLNGFVWDDIWNITSNNFIKSFNNLPLIFSKAYLVSFGEITYRPVATLSYFIDYSIWGDRAFGFHLSNLLLHIFNASLLYLLVNLISANVKLALLTALLFSLHPVNSEAISVVSFREDLWACFFYLLSFILYIQSARLLKQKINYLYGAGLFSFALALFSKEMAVTLPLMLIAYDYFFVFQEDRRKLLGSFKSRYLGFVLVGLFYLWVEFFLMKNSAAPELVYPGGSFYTNLLTMSRVLVHYIYLAFFPIYTHLILHGNNFISHSFFTPPVFFCTLLIIISFFAGYKIKRFSKEMSFSIYWFFIALLPVSNIVLINNFVANRYLYIPIIGFCFFLAVFLLKLPSFHIFSLRKETLLKISKNAIIILLIFYSMFSLIRNRSYRDSISLWSEMTDIYPDSFEAHSYLAYGFFSSNLYDKAIQEYNTAINLTPPGFITEDYMYLGLCYYAQGMPVQALEAFNKALESNPGSGQLYFYLGSVFKDQGSYTKAIDYFLRAIELDPDLVKAYNGLGVIYAKMDDRQTAEKYWQKALAIDPDNKEVLQNLIKSK